MCATYQSIAQGCLGYLGLSFHGLLSPTASFRTTSVQGQSSANKTTSYSRLEVFVFYLSSRPPTTPSIACGSSINEILAIQCLLSPAVPSTKC